MRIGKTHKAMNIKILLAKALLLLTLCCSFQAAAQDLKPVRDKQTKKYGYQAKNKTWVIEPRFDGASRFNDGFAEVTLDGKKGLIDADGQMILPAEYDDIKKFDKNGLCEVIRKEGKTKLHGVADRSGRIIVPVDCQSVNIPKKGGLITAQRPSQDELLEGIPLWGVYDMDGQEIFPPQFLSAPSFSGGTGIAKSALNGLTGVVSEQGAVLLPFEYLAISHHGDGFRTLDPDFTRTTWSADLLRGESYRQPGAIIPYDPMDDVLPGRPRAATCGWTGATAVFSGWSLSWRRRARPIRWRIRSAERPTRSRPCSMRLMARSWKKSPAGAIWKPRLTMASSTWRKEKSAG